MMSSPSVTGSRAWVSGLWLAFVLTHVVVALLGWIEPNQPRGDIYNVYEPWSRQALRGDGIVGVTEPWVYPPLALAPMLVAHVFAPLVGYEWSWVIVVFIANAAVFALLVGRGRSRSRRWAAGFWIIFLLALGPIAVFRIDAVTVPMAIAAMLVIRHRPLVAAALLSAAAWIKIWPGALLAAAFAALTSKRRFIEGTLVVSGVVIGVVALGGGLGFLFGFMTMQSDRGLQAESVFATPFLWNAVAGAPGSGIYFDAGIITFQVRDAAAEVLAGLLTPLLLVAAVTLSALGYVAHARGVTARELMPPLALALVLAFIVFNKVGSPQFQTWLIAPIILWVLWDRRRALPYAIIAVMMAALTHAVYPLFYDEFVRAEVGIVIAITARNTMLIALLLATIVRVSSLAIRGPVFHPHRTPRRSSFS